MRVAVIGAGSVGRALATRLAGAHGVTLAARGTVDAPPAGVGTGSVADAIAAADVVVVAVPGAAVPALAAEHGTALAGLIVIDASNDVAHGRAGPLHHVAEWRSHAPAAEVARAFCTVGWENMADPVFDGVPATLLWCGPDGPAGETVAGLIGDVGFEPVRIGDLDAADVLDGATRLWFQLVLREGYPRRTAYRLLG